MPLPDFICVGAQKAGTSRLLLLLNQHPEILIQESKEGYFFYSDRLMSKGIEWYEANVSRNYSGEKLIGDVGPKYMFEPSVPQNIYRYLGGSTKLIFILRHPVDRAYSQYIMHKKVGRQTNSFPEAVESEIRGESNTTYIARGRYAEQIRRYIDIFDKDRMHFVIFEEFVGASQKLVFEDILRFLDVSVEHVDLDIHVNKGGLPRNKAFKFIYSQNKVIDRVRKVVARNKKVQELARNIFQKKPDALHGDVRESMFESYFAADFDDLKSLVNKDFKAWKIS